MVSQFWFIGLGWRIWTTSIAPSFNFAFCWTFTRSYVRGHRLKGWFAVKRGGVSRAFRVALRREHAHTTLLCTPSSPISAATRHLRVPAGFAAMDLTLCHAWRLCGARRRAGGFGRRRQTELLRFKRLGRDALAAEYISAAFVCLAFWAVLPSRRLSLPFSLCSWTGRHVGLLCGWSWQRSPFVSGNAGMLRQLCRSFLPAVPGSPVRARGYAAGSRSSRALPRFFPAGERCAAIAKYAPCVLRFCLLPVFLSIRSWIWFCSFMVLASARAPVHTFLRTM